MGRGAKKPNKGVTFKIVPKSYDDADYGEGPTHVWVPAEEIAAHSKREQSRRQGGSRHRNDDDDDDMLFDDDAMMDPKEMLKALSSGGAGQEDYSTKRNMHMADDTREGDEDLFADADDAEFDADFIQQMIYGAGGEEDEEDRKLRKKAQGGGPSRARGGDDDDDDDDSSSYDDDDDEAKFSYPRHDVSNSVLDRQFERMMAEFEVDAELNDHDHQDPRVQGPLTVEQYAPLLEEFADDRARVNFATDEMLQHKGLLNGLRRLTRENRVFDTDEKGMFFTSILPDKATRYRHAFKEAADENRENTRILIRRQEAEERARFERNAGNEEHDQEIKRAEPRKKAEFDCETVLTTYSTLYNHPNVIAAERKKLNPKAALRELQREKHAARTHGRGGADDDDRPAGPTAEESDDDDDDALVIDISQRPTDETTEEKKLRRQMVKEMQREKRRQKKDLTTAYKSAAVSHNQKVGHRKQQKAQTSLSMNTLV